MHSEAAINVMADRSGSIMLWERFSLVSLFEESAIQLKYGQSLRRKNHKQI